MDEWRCINGWLSLREGSLRSDVAVVVLLLSTALACSSARESQAGPGNGLGSSGGMGAVAPGLDPGRKELHRLNTAEYNATIQDVLGTTLQPANGGWRGGELAGFDNIASVLGVDEAQYDRYFKAAQALATEVMAAEQLRARFVSCELGEASCVKASIEAAGLRLFRRPLEPDELTTFQRVYVSARALGDDESASLALTFQALLSSAQFLYRIELDSEPTSTRAHPLSAFELASRLSYFLWSSAPDDMLLQAAADGSLAQPDSLSAAVDRMLDDPKAERFVTNFAGQWLGARQVPSHPVIPKFYQWTPRVALAASQEMLLFFRDFLRTERSWFDFPTADFNYINGELAYVYGIPTELTGVDAFERVEFHADDRAGFFGLSGFLALSSLDRRTSPSRRGRWIASNLLCTDPPPPPANVAMLEADQDSGAGGGSSAPNVRQSLEQHRRNPQCAACHALFDPYGLALEEYDAIGVYRATYEDGAPIDVSVTLPPSDTHPEGLAVTGLNGLAQALSTDPRLGECVAKKLFTYGLGRTLTASDEPHLRQAQREWLIEGQPPSLRRLIHALVSTEAFRARRGGE